MANQSIYNAFERMWTHVVNALNGKADESHTHDEYTTISNFDDAVDTLQSQVDSKQPIVTGAASTVVESDLTPDCVLCSDNNGKVNVLSMVSSQEVAMLNGVTGNVQTQLDSKANTSDLNFFVVTADTTNNTASHTPAEIEEAYDSGKIVVLNYEGNIAEFGGVIGSYAFFTREWTGSFSNLCNEGYTIDANKNLTIDTVYEYFLPEMSSDATGKILQATPDDAIVNYKAKWVDLSETGCATIEYVDTEVANLQTQVNNLQAQVDELLLLASAATVYSGSDTPDSSIGSDGDIYVEVV